MATIRMIKRFWSDRRGATSIEYALIAVLVSIVIVAGATTIGQSLRTSFNSIGSGLVVTR